MHQQLQKCEENQPNPRHYKNDLPSMGKMKPTAKIMEWKHTQEVLDAWESSHEGKMVRKTWQHGSMLEWPTFLGFCLPQESKRVSQQLMASPIQILGCHTLPISCNNQPNKFLEVLNDWVNETRKVVDSLMGSPSDIWIFPIGPKVWTFPPLSLGHHAPISFNVALT